MKKLLTILFTSIFIFCLFSIGQAAGVCYLMGTVKNSSGTPIIGATVSSSLGGTTQSLSPGGDYFFATQAGSLNETAVKTGYKNWSSGSMYCAPMEVKTKNIVMQPQ